MRSVFVVTSGEYSDYSIHGVFSSEEKAKEWLASVPISVVVLDGSRTSSGKPLYYVKLHGKFTVYSTFDKEEAERKLNDPSIRLGIYDINEYELDALLVSSVTT